MILRLSLAENLRIEDDFENCPPPNITPVSGVPNYSVSSEFQFWYWKSEVGFYKTEEISFFVCGQEYNTDHVVLSLKMYLI